MSVPFTSGARAAHTSPQLNAGRRVAFPSLRTSSRAGQPRPADLPLSAGATCLGGKPTDACEGRGNPQGDALRLACHPDAAFEAPQRPDNRATTRAASDLFEQPSGRWLKTPAAGFASILGTSSALGRLWRGARIVRSFLFQQLQVQRSRRACNVYLPVDQLPRGLMAAGAFCLFAGTANAAPVWVDGLGFRWVDASGQIATDDCWDGKAGRPIDCALLDAMPPRITRPKPRPPCLTPRTPGCPVPAELVSAFRWATVNESVAPYPFARPGGLPPVVVGDCTCRTTAHDPQPVAPIPLPASALLLLSALAMLWRRG